MHNNAIWIDSQNKLHLRNLSQAYPIQANEALIKVDFSGINPADILHGTSAGFNDYVAGYDFAGKVLEVGRDRAATLKIGDRVCGFGAPLKGKPTSYGSHQRYHVARHSIYSVPDNVSLHLAAALPVITHTAADAIFNQLEVPFEAISTQSPGGILIWGGSSAVGCGAIQFAKHAGCFPIIITASERHHDTLRRLGATHCFDYHDEQVVAKVRGVVMTHPKQTLRRVLDAVGARNGLNSTTELCEACCDEPLKTLFASTLPADTAARATWKSVFACRDVSTVFELPSGEAATLPANDVWAARITRATMWALQHYGNGYELPNVEVVEGAEDAIQRIEFSASGGSSLQKFVIRHPL